MALTKELIWAGPVFNRADGMIYRITKDGSSTALDLGTGKFSWVMVLGGDGNYAALPTIYQNAAGSITISAAGSNTHTIDILVVM